MFKETLLQEWESMVAKQLKTENIYEILTKENLEEVQVNPYYDSVSNPLPNLPKIEESTQLVSPYQEEAEENVFAFVLENNVENLTDKIIFVDNKDLAEHISLEDTNRYFSLIDVFSDAEGGVLNEQLAKEMLAKDFERSLCIDVSLHQNSGASIIQQLSVALAKTKELVEFLGSEILDKLMFRVAVGGNYFFEIAKMRALKLLFNQFSKEYGRDDIPYLFAETSLRNKSALDVENNLIRSTLELSAAMIGGADAVYTNDFELGKPSELSREISFKQQIVLAYESIINVFDDAGNGSYYVEALTGQFASKAWHHFIQLEEGGGYCALIQSGAIQQQIYEHAILEQQWVEEGKIKIIGVNLYPKLDKKRDIADLYRPNKLKAVRLAQMFE